MKRKKKNNTHLIPCFKVIFFFFLVLCKPGLKPSSLACQAIVLFRWTTNTTCQLTSLILKHESAQEDMKMREKKKSKTSREKKYNQTMLPIPGNGAKNLLRRFSCTKIDSAASSTCDTRKCTSRWQFSICKCEVDPTRIDDRLI